MNMIIALSLIVLRCSDVNASRRFYEALGLSFTTEKHGAGPEHYACRLGDLVLELYPAAAGKRPVGQIREKRALARGTLGGPRSVRGCVAASFPPTEARHPRATPASGATPGGRADGTRGSGLGSPAPRSQPGRSGPACADAFGDFATCTLRRSAVG